MTDTLAEKLLRSKVPGASLEEDVVLMLLPPAPGELTSMAGFRGLYWEYAQDENPDFFTVYQLGQRLRTQSRSEVHSWLSKFNYTLKDLGGGWFELYGVGGDA